MTWWVLTLLLVGGLVIVGLFVLVIVTSEDRPWTWEDELDYLESQRQARRHAEDATDRWPRPVRRKE